MAARDHDDTGSRRPISSVSRVAKKLSQSALSRASPTEPIDCRIPACRSSRITLRGASLRAVLKGRSEPPLVGLRLPPERLPDAELQSNLSGWSFRSEVGQLGSFHLQNVASTGGFHRRCLVLVVQPRVEHLIEGPGDEGVGDVAVAVGDSARSAPSTKACTWPTVRIWSRERFTIIPPRSLHSYLQPHLSLDKALRCGTYARGLM